MFTESLESLVESHLSQTDSLVAGDPRQALSSTLAAVQGINQGLRSSDQDLLLQSANRIIEKLEDWIKRLVDSLTKIVQTLGNGATFSISVGTSVSVTVHFGPFS